MTAAAAEIEFAGTGPIPVRALWAVIRKDTFLLLMFLSLLLIGADRFAVHAGVTLRIVFPVFMLAFGSLYMRKGTEIAFDYNLGVLFFLLSVAGAISTLHSLQTMKSLGYTIWVLFDFFVILALTYNFAKQYPMRIVLSVWFLAFRIHVLLMIAELVLGVIRHNLGRPQVWFYEPSYFAIFMTAYFGSSLYLLLAEGKPYRLDFFLSLFAILAMGSATGIFGAFLAVCFNVLIARQRLKLLLWAAALIVLFFGTLHLFFSHTMYYQFVAESILNGDFSANIVLDRAGNRWIRVLVGWDAFLHNPWLGVGIGGDSAYMDALPLPNAALDYVRPWTWADIEGGRPFANIFVEVLGTMGIIGFIPFAGIFLYAIRRLIGILSNRSLDASLTAAVFAGFFSTVMALQLDGTMLRYYLWSPLGLALGAAARLYRAAPSALAPQPGATDG